MKLFQQMLVAGATVSLIAPIAAQASNAVNVDEINSYARSQTKSSRIDSTTFINEVSEDIAKLKGRVDGLEAQQNNFEAGAFSCLLYTSPSPRDISGSRMPSSA